MDELKSTAKAVKFALENDVKARNSDDYLYFIICKEKLSEIGVDIKNLSLETALLWRKVYKLPAFETVRRARQKVQAECPELSGCLTVEKARGNKITDYRAFALSNGLHLKKVGVNNG